MRPTSSIVLACVLGWMGGSVRAEVVTLRIGRAPEGRASPRRAPAEGPMARAAQTDKPPVIDGRLDEEVWRGAACLDLSRTLDGQGPAAQPTRVRLLRDAQLLYVGFRCGEPTMDRVVSGSAGPGAQLWACDSVEVFLGTGGTYWHFGVNLAGGTAGGRGKDDAAGVAFASAVARQKDGWTAELSLPIAKLAGGKAPSEWIVNFNRTRLAGGMTQEYAWSPTFSGDSHVPGRFGRLIVAEPPGGQPTTMACATQADAAAASAPVEVLPAGRGVAILRFDLSGVGKGATIYQADLRLFRDDSGPASGPDPSAALKVCAVKGAAKEFSAPRGGADGPALTPRGPAFQTLDATAAVRAWSAAGAGHGDFHVLSAPPLRLEGSCLEIAMEGKAPPGTLPHQVTGLVVFHRAGQTFLTWNDPEDSFGDKPVTWGRLLDYQTRLDPRRQVRYRVYRSDRPIDSAGIRQAELLAEVQPLSAYNTNGWSIERLINQAVFGNEDHGELMKYGPFASWSRGSPEGGELVIGRLAIEDGKALPPGRGLYVQTPAVAGKTYYAVVAVAAGVANLWQFTPANSLAEPISEAPAAPEPVEQPPGEPMGFDFRGQRHFYVTYAAPPLAPRPMYFNWSVLVPTGPAALRPVELYFHAPGYSHARPPVKFLERSIQVCPHDYPFSGWYGYNDAIGTLRSPAEGTVRPFTIRRIEAFLTWARRKFPIDPRRIVAVGGDGAALMALYRPSLFACVLITGFESHQLDPKASGLYTGAWGPAGATVRDEAGLSDWTWGDMDWLLCGRRLPNAVPKGQPPPPPQPDASGMKADLPLFICRGYSWGRDPTYGHGRGRLYYALQATRHGLCAHWAWGGNLPVPEKYTGLWRGLDLTNVTPFPAITFSADDKEGEGSGHCNHGYSWRDVSEDERSFEVTVVGPEGTFDLTPRRLGRLRCAPGEKFAWQAVGTPGKPEWSRAKQPPEARGEVTADAAGLVTVAGLQLTRGWDLKVTIRKAPQP